MSTKKQLQKLIGDFKNKQTERKVDYLYDNEAKNLISKIQGEQTKALEPVLRDMAEKMATEMSANFDKAVKSIKVDVPKGEAPQISINVPDVIVPDFEIPTPIVNYTPPAIKIPKIEMPKEMDIKGWVSLMGVSLDNPLPVQLRDASGKPVDLNALTTVTGGSGGGKGDYFTIKGYGQSAFAEIQNADGRIKVATETDLDIRDLDYLTDDVSVYQVSGAIWSVNIAQQDVSPSVSQVSGAIWSVNVAQQDVSQLVHQVSGSNWSVEVATQPITFDVRQVSGGNDSVSVTNTVTVSATDLDIRDLVNTSDSVRAYQLSGSSWSVEATQSGTWNIATVTTVTGVTNSVAAAIIDSSGVQYSTSNPVPVGDAGGTLTVDASNLDIRDLDNATDSVRSYQLSGASWSVEATISGTPTVTLSGSLNSAVVVGDTNHDAADDGPSPVKIGAKAESSLEGITAVADGDRTNLYADTDGVLYVKPFTSFGDIITERTVEGAATVAAFITFSAGGAGVRNYVTDIDIHNSSSTDAYVDLHDGLGGEAFYTFPAPKTGGVSKHFTLPLKQPTQNANLAYRVSGAVSSMFISLQGFQSKL